MSPKTRRNIVRILPFGLIWLFSGLVFLVVEHAASSESGHPSTVVDMDLEIFIFSNLAITAVGLLVGTIELLYLNKRFAKQSFARKILYKTLIYIALLLLVTVITFPIASSLELDMHLFDPRVWERLLQYLMSITHLSTDLQLAVALGLSLFYAEISENIGHGILLNFFTGKYHHPQEEERIFLFLDMKSSTTIAEQIGHVRYFELLREYYYDLSDAIIQYGGEIYQYVGDEVVITWKLENGVRNHHCLRCFFAMKQALARRKDWYEATFGHAPAFKGGMHAGEVTTGEIGALKKEIIFTGDVLNATARIQGLCNAYGVDLLISDSLYQQLNPDESYQGRSVGQHELRGKTEQMELWTVALT